MANMAHPNAPKMQDNKPRQALGPRLKTYLSSTNLLSLVHQLETPSAVKGERIDWPDIEPIYDETTTANTKLDKWVAAIRYRLWKYDDVPLSIKYNNPLLRLTDECIKVSKKNTQLGEEILHLEQQNRVLLRKNSQQSRQYHRAVHSHSGIPSLADTLINDSKLQFSRSTSISPTRFSETAPRVVHKGNGRDSRSFASSRNMESPVSLTSSDQSNIYHGLLPDDEEEFQSRQDAAFRLSSYVAKNTGSDIESHYREIAKILRVPTSIPDSTPAGSGASTSSHNSAMDDNDSHLPKLILRRQQPGNRSPPKERIFSFYPGDDNLQDSLAVYTMQQQSLGFVQQASSGLHKSETAVKLPKTRETIKTIQDSALARGDSQDSTVTVMRLSQSKTPKSRVSSESGTSVTGKSTGRIVSQESKGTAKPQGPLAAAIAATAKFSKTAKKTPT